VTSSLFRRTWPPPAWLASGLLCGSGYLFIPGSPLPLLAWIGLVPLLLRLESVRGFRRFYAEALAMLWVMELLTLGRVFSIGPALSLLVVTGQALVTSVVFIALWLLRGALGWRAALLALPACWTAWEWLYSKQPMQIPTFLGATQADFYPLIQFYDVTGVWGGTLLIVGCNVLVTVAISRAQASGRGAWFIARAVPAVVAAIWVLPLAYAAWVFSTADAVDPAASVRVALTQTGDPGSLGVAPVTMAAQASESVLPEKPDLLLWPETALQRDATSAQNLRLWNSFYAWVAQNNVPVLTGITDVETYRDPPPLLARWGQKDEYFNAATLITPQLAYYALTQPSERSLDVKVYRKRELFPFGERVPFVETFPSLHTLVTHAPDQPPRNYGAGNQPVVFAFLDRGGAKHRIGAFICFEILFPHVAADLVRAGAEILATVSNDQHLNDNARWVTAAHARIRAIETRRSVARVNTVGYSLFVDPYGRVDYVAPLDTAGASMRPMQLRDGSSIYVRWGDWLPAACALISLLLGLAASARALWRRGLPRPQSAEAS
jgi:apolipoprotein N-acyltransferase